MISIVIPVYNEEENVEPLYHEIKDTMDTTGQTYEVLFIDDGSTDNTLNNLQSLLKNGDSRKILRILELENNVGQTPALLAGFRNAKGDLIVTMDGDMQNDPKDITKMLESLTPDIDVLCGWRKNRQDNIFKKAPSKINNFLNRQLNNVDIHDSGCTLRLYRKEAVDGIQLYAEGHRYIPAVIANEGFSVKEVVTNHRPRTLGKTKYGFKRLFRGFIDLFTLGAIHKWGKKPSHLFSLWSFIYLVGSVLTFSWALLERFAYHFWSLYDSAVSLRNNLFVFTSIALFLFSILLLFLGFIAELVLRSNYDSHKSYSIKKEWN